VVESVKGVPAGTALDGGMGQGRNAVYLATQGWKVTGFDLSGQAVKAASANAAKAGVGVDAVKASYADFDFGTARWDLIVLIFAWAPMTRRSWRSCGHRFGRTGESCSSTSSRTRQPRGRRRCMH
jgi:2-polyprenyl-3-methyl-5-hydroxy-6-metoxy-1,4-benzoquinol methylase